MRRGAGSEMVQDTEGRVRASNHERSLVITRLNDAYADGRLDLDEATDRIARAHETTWRDDLFALVNDLPATRETAVPRPTAPPHPPAAAVDWFVTLFGDIRRRGRWRSPERSLFISLFGDTDLDYRDAAWAEAVCTVSNLTIFGDVRVVVPPGVRVVPRVFSVFGDRHGGVVEPGGSEAPTLVIRRFSLFGDTTIDVEPAPDPDLR